MNSICVFRHLVRNSLNNSKSLSHRKLNRYPSRKNLNFLLQIRYMKMDNSKFEILPSPIKSESDKKDYRVIKLQNELTACLISDLSITEEESVVESDESENESENSLSYSSDSESDESQASSTITKKKSNTDQKRAAAALCIGVGSFSDPKDVPGMAHFLEHMVFMGSEKFPAENDFDSFIKKGGGSDNASTDTETTCFYFECLQNRLYEGLDKFAQFFISPLMKKGAMTRERESIESEFQMALPSDASRREQLLFSLARQDSPVNQFSWGNLKTLRDNISDEKLYEGVHAFRKRHYSAHRMTLAIQARLPLDALQNYVTECFSNVPNNKLRKDDFSAHIGVFDTPQFNRLYYVKPLKELIKLDLCWSLPSLLNKYKSKPLEYVAFLVGDEGIGSLLSYLKKKMWAISITAGNEESGGEHNSLYALFTVSLVLSEEGLQHVYEIIEAVFSYINLIKNVGPQRRIFDELKLITETSFRFSTERSPADNVEDLCESMQLYPSADYIAGNELFYEYDPKGITMVMDSLTPKTVNVMITTKKLPADLVFNKEEQWFGTEYTDIDIPSELILRWETVDPYPELNIPPLNLYIADNFAILPTTANHPEFPQKLIDTPSCQMWYRKDQTFKLPMACYYFYVINPASVESARSLALLDVFMNLLLYALAEEVYPATTANLVHDFVAHEKGIVMKVSGFNEKLPILIEVITKYIKNLQDYIDEGMFTVVKDTVQKYYYNRLLKPSVLAKDSRLKLLIGNYWTPVEKYCDLLDITYADIQQFIGDYRKQMYVKALVQGNVLGTVATDTVNKFVDSLDFGVLPKEKYPMFVISKIPLGQKCLKIESFNKNDANSITANYYQVGPFNMKESVIIDIVMMIIEEPLFDILRTKEQLGYHVYCTSRDTYGILGFSITVHSQVTKFATQHLDFRIEEFLKVSHKMLVDIDVEELEQIKEDLIKTKQLIDSDLKEEMDRNWSEIINDEYMFDRTAQEVKEIRKITKEELPNWWSSQNQFGEKENFRKLSVQIVGHPPNRNASSNGDIFDECVDKKIRLKLVRKGKDVKNPDYIVDDIDKFRAQLHTYPVRPT